jgi:hypothetical protein
MDEPLDPWQKADLALLRAEHQRHFQVMINFIKEEVGDGVEYANAVARIVVSKKGAYYELNDLPEEFSGCAGDEVETEFLKPGDAVSLLTRAYEATRRVTPETTRRFAIMALYTRRGIIDRKSCYLFDYCGSGTPTVIGAFQPGVMPLFFKIRLEADFAGPIIGRERGIVFCLANPGDRHILVRIPLDVDDLTDLTGIPQPKIVN